MGLGRKLQLKPGEADARRDALTWLTLRLGPA
jgi:hypothetical protein